MSDLDELVPHMRSVQAAERDLRDLGVIWQTIECSAAISCPDDVAAMLPTLVETRTRFDQLQRRLIEQMVLENRAELGDTLAAKAQGVIDILVRNLYERTADVGFLATDEVVRSYCSAAAPLRAERRPAMLQRLTEYQAKYTVYDDVMLLSQQGELLARLDEASAGPPPALAVQAVAASGYIERFMPAEPAAARRAALLYAHRIGSAGALVLRFKFDDEMRRIFDAVNDDPQRLVLMLVDETQQVIASSDEAHVAVGAQAPSLTTGMTTLTAFAGREYMAVCCASQGYQGYAGPPWRVLAMVSLLTAFRQRQLDDAGQEAVPVDNTGLAAVQAEADAINRELRRELWSGGVTMAGEQVDRARLKAVLRQVASTGSRSRARVQRALHDIYRVSLARGRHQARELARLGADILDRNLYERANDCRWWALSPVVRRVLAEPASTAGTQALQAVLAHINGLYTVYSQLLAFDRQGTVRACSTAEGQARWAGQAVPPQWLTQVAGLTTSQRYAVTPLEATGFHDDGPTWVYLAAVSGPAGSTPVGGIAIVFHAARELGAVLRDIVGERAGFAAFVDAQGQVSVASDAALARGAMRGFSGSGDSAVVEHEGVHYACARVRSPGYREFKLADGYDHGLCAVVGLRLGHAERRRMSFADFELAVAPPQAGEKRLIEVAVFQVGASRYALPTRALRQALPPAALMRTPASGATLGMVVLDDGSRAGQPLVRVVCARQLFGVDYPARQTDGVVIVLNPPHGGGAPIGLRVDDVLSVLEVPAARLHPAAGVFASFSARVDAVIDIEAIGPTNRHAALLQLLSHERLFDELQLPTALAARAVVKPGAAAAATAR